jgi:hypothetical protein
MTDHRMEAQHIAHELNAKDFNGARASLQEEFHHMSMADQRMFVQEIRSQEAGVGLDLRFGAANQLEIFDPSYGTVMPLYPGEVPGPVPMPAYPPQVVVEQPVPVVEAPSIGIRLNIGDLFGHHHR